MLHIQTFGFLQSICDASKHLKYQIVVQELIYSFKTSSSVCPSFKQEKNYAVWPKALASGAV